MEIALIGLRGSGKTTLFKALTGRSSDGEPQTSLRGRIQIGVAKVSDPRLEALSGIFQPQKVTPAEITYWDIPVPLDEGGQPAAFGGQFLNQLQGADALIHVVRAFEDPTVPHPQGSVDPLRDMDTLGSELAFSDLLILERRAARVEAGMKGAKGHERDLLIREQGLLQRVRETVEKGEPVHGQSFSPEEARLLANFQLLTGKPLLLVLNVAEEVVSNKSAVETLLARTPNKDGSKGVVLCAKLEAELAELSPQEQVEFRGSLGLGESGVQVLIQRSLSLLGMISFFTFVSQEVRAWTVPRETLAVQAAGRIHSDMERGFIRAEVVSLDNIVASGSIAEARKQGLLRAEGKTYQVQDGDVITFLFNV